MSLLILVCSYWDDPKRKIRYEHEVSSPSFENTATKFYHTASQSKLSKNHDSVWQRLPPSITTHYHGPGYPTTITLTGKPAAKYYHTLLQSRYSTANNLIGKDCCQILSHIITVKVTQQPSTWLARLRPNITIHYHSQGI